MATIRFIKWVDEWEAWRDTSDNWEEEFCEWYNFDARIPGPPVGYMVCMGHRLFYGPRDFVAWLLRQAWSKLPFNK
jgi:hypothetical protein